MFGAFEVHPGHAVVRAAAVLLSEVALFAVVSAAPAQEGTRPRWESLANAMAAPWPDLQGTTGGLADYTDGLPGSVGRHYGTRYGDAVMGYALIEAGVREGDRRLARTGVRAVSVAIDPRRRPHRPSVFENLAVAAAYNIARSGLGGDREFARRRRRWEAWLRRVKIVRLGRVDGYGNHWLVDAVAILEIQRTGLRSRSAASALGGEARRDRRLATALINVRIPQLFSARGYSVLSDPPDHPLAYHGLSLGLYARAVQLLGARAAPSARRVLRRAVRAAAVMMAPNGSVAYLGRSQEEVWAPAGIAFGAAYTAQLPGSKRADARLCRSVAQRSLARLEQAYPTTRAGIAITPAVGLALRPGWRGLDAYAGAPSMGGLALMMLNWTLGLNPPERDRGRLPADRRFAAVISRGAASFAVVRKGATWFAVRRSRSHDARYRHDLRYDAGLAVALRRSGGRWGELVPERPRTTVGDHGSSAPMLLSRGSGRFVGRSIRVGASGVVRLRGVYRRGAAPPRRASLVYRPVRCGVALAFQTRAGDVYRTSGFFSRRPRLIATGATDGHQTMLIDADRVDLAIAPDRLASGEQPRLWRVRAVVRARTARRITIRYCS